MNRAIALSISVLGLCLPAMRAAEPSTPWQRPAPAALMTRWASQVNPSSVHDEYPRPQLVRSEWLNLNGLWDYAIRPLTSGVPRQYDGRILVPFPPESALSGVGRRLDEQSTLWYRRTITIPAGWKGRRVRLQFGAVDWQCKLVVNGHELGQHRGGYSRFAFDISDDLKWEGEEEIVLGVNDPTEGDQPRGKQSRKPEGIFYSPTSGLWQTVWLEPVAEVCVDQLKLTPDLDANGLRLRVALESMAEDVVVEAVARMSNAQEGRVSGAGNTDLFLPLPKPRLWSPDTPSLYDLEVRILKGGRELDRVSSYFGMRKISLVQDKQGFTRIALNGQPLFELGALDQGFWPDGICTAPSDAALQSDLGFLKSAGFNLVRKHVKIEPERWYYWCDKMGLLVWQDMPSGNNATAAGQREFEAELLHMINDLYNHPAVVMWILFNEGWGQYDTQRLTQRLKALDPSRLVNSASGWTDMRAGDIVDVHNYPGPAAPEPDTRRASVLGEFGGLGLVVEGHSWAPDRHWGYRMEPERNALVSSYSRLIHQVRDLSIGRGLSAAVYTQTSDVETECNGLMSYDRAIRKLEVGELARANAVINHPAVEEVIAADALVGSASWRYTTESPATNWFTSDFDDADWKSGLAGFGTSQTPAAIVKTTWNTANIWLRRDFTITQGSLQGVQLEVHHDEDAEIYLNGVLAANLPGFISNYDRFNLLPEALGTLKPGLNRLAVHCHQTTGGQYIDVGLIVPAQ